MKHCLLGAALFALLWLVGGCGTYRVITDDYDTDAPILMELTPTQVVSGQQVTFQANFCDVSAVPMATLDSPEGMPADFFWDFGGGAEPNTSLDEMPEVTIRDGLRSPYSAQLTVRNGCLGDNEATYDFQIFVTPVDVLGVTPLVGIAGGGATFSVIIGSGNITSYAWDFGGGCDPGGSNVANPNVSFSETPGVYQCRVVVGNNFEVFEFPFTLTVLPAADSP